MKDESPESLIPDSPLNPPTEWREKEETMPGGSRRLGPATAKKEPPFYPPVNGGKEERKTMKILKYLMVAVMLLLVALPAQAQIQVDRWTRIQKTAVTSGDTLYGTADTLDQTRIIRIYCKDWPYEQWSMAVKLATFTGKDSADTVFSRIWFLYDAGGTWTAKANVDTFTAGTASKWVYQEITRPQVKPCSLKVDCWAKDANTCSTKVVDIKVSAQ